MLNEIEIEFEIENFCIYEGALLLLRFVIRDDYQFLGLSSGQVDILWNGNKLKCETFIYKDRWKLYIQNIK